MRGTASYWLANCMTEIAPKRSQKNPWLADHPEITKSLDFLQYREDNRLDDD